MVLPMSAFPLLPRMVAARMFADLCKGLPPLPDDSPDERTERDLVAIAAILALGPIRDVEEASLAIAVVSADFHARDALQDAGRHRDSIKVVMQCRAQALSMMRQRHVAAGKLAALQALHPPPLAETGEETLDSAPIVDPGGLRRLVAAVRPGPIRIAPARPSHPLIRSRVERRFETPAGQSWSGTGD